MFSDCNLSKTIEETRGNMDHSRQIVKLSYESWNPRVILYPDGSIDGYMPRIANAIADMLNLTIEYKRVKDTTAGRLPNGSYAGDIGEIASGVVDGSIWGYVASLDRTDFVDFVIPLAHASIGILIRTPTSDDVSVRNYVSEFKNAAWTFLLVSNIAFWALFGFLLQYSSSKSRKKETVVLTLTIMMRTIINKVSIEIMLLAFHAFQKLMPQGSPLPATNTALRVGFLFLTFAAMLIFFYYKATMNAFLAAKIIKMPINSFEDVVESDMEFLVKRGFLTESMFSHAPSGSLYHDIYREKLLDKKRMDDYGGIAGSIKHVIDGDAMIFTSLDPFLRKAEYPCQMVDVEALKYLLFYLTLAHLYAFS